MKIFGINFGSGKAKFQISDEDRHWVESNFHWLISVFGYPRKQHGQILLNEQFFSETFKSKKVDPDLVIMDLCKLFEIDRAKVSFVIEKDIRDSYGLPYEMHGKPFECEVEVVEGKYILRIANFLLTNAKRFLFSLIYEFICIRFFESKLDFNRGTENDGFRFLASIYFGFGLIFSSNLDDVGSSTDGEWQRNWNNSSGISNDLMVFALATYSSLLKEDNPEWKQLLSNEMKIKFDEAIDLIKNSDPVLVNEAEIKIDQMVNQAFDAYKHNNFPKAINILEEVLKEDINQKFRAELFNNLGYFKLRFGKYEDSISDFKEAIKLNSEFAYAYDNLGYAFIMNDEPEMGKRFLDKAIKTEGNDMGYSMRNLALYYEKKDLNELAEEYFQKAFNVAINPVDLLEYHYAKFLYKTGKTIDAFIYLKKAVEKKEYEAMELYKEAIEEWK